MEQIWNDEKLEERFWSRVDIRSHGECWEWQGQTAGNGYGFFRLNGKKRPAHRVSWMLTNRQQIPTGMHILHSCDHPPCVNPSHLRLGTHAENMREKAAKGRASGSPVLSPKDVERIRLLYALGGATQLDLSRQFGVSQSQISLIVNGKAWKNVPMPPSPRQPLIPPPTPGQGPF